MEGAGDSSQGASISSHASFRSPETSNLRYLFEDDGNPSSSPFASGQTTPCSDILAGFEQQHPSSIATGNPNQFMHEKMIVPKESNRFTKEVVQALKRWLVAHKNNPYPTSEEIDWLQYQTGLSKTQIANWFANARRRGKMRKTLTAPRQAEPTTTQPVDIVQRPGTPAPRQDWRSLSPLERWYESPPEHEPAAASAIARAAVSSTDTTSCMCTNVCRAYGTAESD